MALKEFLKKYKLKESDLVEAVSEGEAFSGTILPGKEAKTLFLKLDSGYNIGLETGKISSIKKVSAGQKLAKPKQSEIKQDSGLPKIAILHTGGTIASRVDYRTGAVYSAFTPEDLLTMFPELMDIGNFSSRLIRNMWTDDFRFKHFGVIAKAIQEEAKKGTEGIILTMGTDNLAVVAAGLSFVLEKCPLPIIITGAQRSSDRGSSDAAMNLICAAEFIAKSDFAGVGICMHASGSDIECAILPACKTRKMHTSRRDAFKPINDTEIAKLDYKTKEIKFLKQDYARKAKGEKILAKPNFEEKVGLLKITINMFPEQFSFYQKNKFKGLIIEATGLGHTPGQMPDEITKKAHKNIFPAIKAFAKNNPVVATSQCLYGRVQMHVYDKGMDLMDLGVIPGEDMLPEIAFVKLAWLLGNYKDKKKVRELMVQNLRGEISPCTKIETFDL